MRKRSWRSAAATSSTITLSAVCRCARDAARSNTAPSGASDEVAEWPAAIAMTRSGRCSFRASASRAARPASSVVAPLATNTTPPSAIRSMRPSAPRKREQSSERATAWSGPTATVWVGAPSREADGIDGDAGGDAAG